MHERGKLLVISGFSGSGKGTVLKSLMTRYDGFAYSVSMTTRGPRTGEVEGRDYYFVEPEYFRQMVENDGFLECAEFVGDSYGTPRDPVERMLAEGKNVILEIEVCGAMQIRRKCPDAILIFIAPSSYAELRRRLIGRGTESMKKVEDRLSKALVEVRSVPEYDHLIINECGRIDEAADMIADIVSGKAVSEVDKNKFAEDFLNNNP